MRHFPVFLDLQDRACLVIGATEEARCKAQVLREAGATVATIDDISAWSGAAYALAVVATGDLDRDTEAARCLRPSIALINVVDRPSLCSFIWPALVERGPVTVAISTGGTSPTLAALIRQRIERVIPVAVGDLARLAGRLRRVVAAAVPTAADRRRFWRRALEGRAGALAFAGRSAASLAALKGETRALRRPLSPPS
jgi:uroporphyrin-III C-methyltransferase / precorrin-2 dehydrogenase / sirohydrochlorin ferrochelatase